MFFFLLFDYVFQLQTKNNRLSKTAQGFFDSFFNASRKKMLDTRTSLW